MKKLSLCFLALLGFLSLSEAEPYLAARSGYKCSVCHINKSGGGKRTDFGVIYAQTTMPMNFANPKNQPGFFDGKVSDAVSIGANFRVDDVTKMAYTPTAPDSFTNAALLSPASRERAAGITEGNLYIQVDLMPEFLTFYLDQTMAPSTLNREIFGMVHGLPMDGYVKFGRMLLPYGLRIMDDNAFIRNNTGFTYNAHDLGLEAGIEPGAFSLIANLTETQLSTVGSVVYRAVRVGGSYAVNTDDSNISRYGVFGTLNFGIFTFMSEVDIIKDVDPSLEIPNVKRMAVFNELNVLAMEGLNFKLTHEFFDRNDAIDNAQDGQDRATIGVEPFVSQFLQLGLFYRVNRFVPQNLEGNRNQIIARAHIFF